MTFNEILTQANLHSNMSIDSVVGMRYCNEALMFLASLFDSAKVTDERTLEVTANTWTKLPEGFLGAIECVVNGCPVTSYELSKTGDKIKFSMSGTLELAYFKTPTLITGATQTPDIHSAYHHALGLFMAARERQRVFADEESDSIRLMRDFNTTAAMANKMILSMRKGRKTIKVSHFI